MLRRRFGWMTLAAVAAVAFAACGAVAFNALSTTPEAPRVAFVTAGSGPYWQRAVRGAREAAKKYAIDLRVAMPPDGSLARQTASLLDVVADRPEGIAICPAEPGAQRDAIDELAKDSHVVTFDVDAPGTQRRCFIGSGDYTVGRRCAQVVREALPAGGKIAVFVADADDDRLGARLEGFQKEVRRPAASPGAANMPVRWNSVECMEDGGDNETAGRNVRRALAQHADLACIVDLTGRPATAVLRALQDSGRAGEVRVVVLDQSDETLAAIEAGMVHASVLQDPYAIGYEAVRRLASFISGPAIALPARGLGSAHVPNVVVQRGNVAEFRSRCSRCQRGADLPAG